MPMRRCADTPVARPRAYLSCCWPPRRPAAAPASPHPTPSSRHALGQYLRLAGDLQAGRLGDQPSITYDRYVAHPTSPALLRVTVPARDLSGYSEQRLIIRGRVAPAGRVAILVSGAAGGDLHTPTVAADGTFAASVTLPNAQVVRVSIAAGDAPGGTALVVRKIIG